MLHPPSRPGRSPSQTPRSHVSCSSAHRHAPPRTPSPTADNRTTHNREGPLISAAVESNHVQSPLSGPWQQLADTLSAVRCSISRFADESLLFAPCQSPTFAPRQPVPPYAEDHKMGGYAPDCIHRRRPLEQLLPDFPLPEQDDQKLRRRREASIFESPLKLNELISWDCHPLHDCDGLSHGQFKIQDGYMNPEVSYGSFPPHTLITIGGRSIEVASPVSLRIQLLEPYQEAEEWMLLPQHADTQNLKEIHPDFSRCEVAFSLSYPQTHIFCCGYAIHIDSPVKMSWRSFNAILRIGPDADLVCNMRHQKDTVVNSCCHRHITPPNRISHLDEDLDSIPVQPTPLFKPPDLFPTIWPAVETVDIPADFAATRTEARRPTETVGYHSQTYGAGIIGVENDSRCSDSDDNQQETDTNEQMMNLIPEVGQFYIPCDLPESCVNELIRRGYVPTSQGQELQRDHMPVGDHVKAHAPLGADQDHHRVDTHTAEQG